MEKVIRVKCKSYYWGFCAETEIKDKDGNRDYCKKEKCLKFKIRDDEK